MRAAMTPSSFIQPALLDNGIRPSLPTLAIVIAIFTLYWVYQRIFHPLSKVPGPLIASLTRLWLGRQFRSLKMHRIEMGLHHRYGSVVRIAPTEVSVSSPQAMQLLYGAGSRFEKSDWYVCCGSRKEKEAFNLMGETDMSQYRTHRRLITPAYTVRAMQHLQDGMHKVISRFVEVITEKNGETIDLTLWINLFAIDLLTNSLFSNRLGLLDAGKDDGSISANEISSAYAHWSGLFPSLYAFNSWVIKRFGVHLLDKHAPYPAVPWCLSQMEARLESIDDTTSQSQDILAKLMDLRAQNAQLKRDDVIAMAFTTLYAGFDTMGITLTATLCLIASTPGCQERIHAELDAVRAQGQISSSPTFEETKQLPYFQACISEAMRYHPTTGTTLPRVVPKGGAEIDGYFLPEGTTVGISPWVLHRDKSIFGHDADEYRPERWLEASQDKRYEMEKYSLEFGGVTRSCPGKHLALVAMNMMLARILMEFTLHLNKTEGVEEICMFSVRLENVKGVFSTREAAF
ncbi:cytochrome P450 [Trichoderma barbatum]